MLRPLIFPRLLKNLAPVYGLTVSLYHMGTHDVDWGIALLNTLGIPIPTHDIRECVGGLVTGDLKSPSDLRSRVLRKVQQVQCFHQGKRYLEVDRLRSIAETYFPEPLSHVSFRDD